MAHNPDKAYQAAQVYAARDVVAKVEEELVVLQEARFFVDTDTMRDIIDPQGAAACIHYLLGEEIPQNLLEDPNVAGLIDEFDLMKAIPAAKLAVHTLFHSSRFRDLLRSAIESLQAEFGEAAGETPNVLHRYFNGEILI
jgi:hypothetical protein